MGDAGPTGKQSHSASLLHKPPIAGCVHSHLRQLSLAAQEALKWNPDYFYPCRLPGGHLTCVHVGELSWLRLPVYSPPAMAGSIR